MNTSIKNLIDENLSPKTIWSLEESLYIFNILNAISPKMEVEDSINYDNESYYIFKTISHHLKKHDIPFELIDLWHTKRNKRLCVLLDCGGIIWSILGSQGIKESLRFLKCGIENIEFREHRSRSILTCINSTRQVLEHTQKSTYTLQDIIYFSLVWTTKNGREGQLDFSLALPSDFFLNINELKEHLKKYEQEQLEKYNIKNLRLAILSYSELPMVDNLWVEDLKSNSTPTHYFVFYKDEVKHQPNLSKIYTHIGQLPMTFSNKKEEQKFIHELGANLYCLKTNKKKNDYHTNLQPFSIASSTLCLTQRQHQESVDALEQYLGCFKINNSNFVRELPIIQQIGKFITQKKIESSFCSLKVEKLKKERF